MTDQHPIAEPEPNEPTDEELLEINYGAYCPGADEANDEDDSSWQYTSDYIGWLDENGTPEEQAAYTAKGLRAVFKAGLRAARRPKPSLKGQSLAEPQPQPDPLGTIHPIEPPQRDYAFIYAKIARHVTAADVQMAVGKHAAARDELNQALIAMEAFETTLLTVTTDG